MAAGLFRRRLAHDDGAVVTEAVNVLSAGLLPGGFASPPEVVTAMAEHDVDLAGHRSTQVSPELVARADVVIGMARRHAREVVLLDPAAWGRTFTLKEIVRRGDSLGARPPDGALTAWLGRLHHGRARGDLVGSAPADDVSDPLGGPLDAYRGTAIEIEGLVDRLAGLLWAPRPIRPLHG
jgi:protein-tyrosine phosphatase